MRKYINKLASYLVLVTFSLTSLLQPIQATAGTSTWIAPPSGSATNWASFASNAQNWVYMPNSMGYGQTVGWPKPGFVKLADIDFVPNTSDPNYSTMRMKMADAERWMVNGREEIGIAGIPNNQISDRINQFPKTASYVFAAYTPESAELIIEVQKVEKLPNGKLTVSRADYTPWHGEKNKWRRDYMTDSEKLNPVAVGYNPFENFKGASVTDKVFHNISWEGASVAIGHAMKEYDAHMGWIASDKTRFTQVKKKSGGMLKKKIKVTITGWVKPQWFVATPLGVQSGGGMAAICVKNIGGNTSYGNTSTCDSPKHLALSGVSIKSWEGSGLPETEEKAYEWVYKKSSFTVLAFTIITFALTWGVASALSTVVGAGAAAGAAAGGLSPLAAASIGAGIYAGVAALQGAGLTAAQAGWAGSTGNGVIKPGYGSMDKHQLGLTQGVRNRHINSPIGTGLQGTTQLYSGNCPQTYSIQQCYNNGLDPGTMHRVDNYAESNVTLQLQTEKEKCWDALPLATKQAVYTDPVVKEQVRKQVQQCAAPKRLDWEEN